MITTAIFDLDGTLVSSVGLHEKAWQELFREYGITLNPAELKEQSGKKNDYFANLIIGRRGRTDLDPQKISDEKDGMAVALLKREPAVAYPHTKELLRKLTDN